MAIKTVREFNGRLHGSIKLKINAKKNKFDNFKWDEDLSSIINKFLEKNKCDIISYRKANLYSEYVIVDGEGNLSKEKIGSNNFIVNIFGTNNRAYKKILESHNQIKLHNNSTIQQKDSEEQDNQTEENEKFEMDLYNPPQKDLIFVPETPENVQEEYIQENYIQEEYIQEENTQEKIIQEENMKEETSQEETSQEEITQEKTIQEEIIQEETIQEETIQEEIIQEEIIQEVIIHIQNKIIQEDYIQEDYIQEANTQEKIIQEEIIQEEIIQEEIIHDDNIQVKYTQVESIQEVSSQEDGENDEMDKILEEQFIADKNRFKENISNLNDHNTQIDHQISSQELIDGVEQQAKMLPTTVRLYYEGMTRRGFGLSRNFKTVPKECADKILQLAGSKITKSKLKTKNDFKNSIKNKKKLYCREPNEADAENFIDQ